MNTPTPKKRILPFVVLSVSWLAASSHFLEAQTAQTWNNAAATGLWNTTDTNWNSSAWTNNNNAVFGSTSGTTVTSASGVVVNDMSFTTTGYTIAGTLSLANDLASTITVSADLATISASLLDNSLGASVLTKSGTGILALSGSNSYSGGTKLTAGVLALNNAYALGTGTLTISSGTLSNTSGGTVVLATNNAQKWTGGFGYAGSGTLNLGTGAVTMTLNESVVVSSGNLIVGGVIGGSSSSYGITKSGNGTLTLTGLNTYGFATIVTGGTLAATTLANGGVASSIGASGNSGWALQLKTGGALEYIGTGSTTDRAMYIDTAGTIDNEGSGALVFSNTSAGIGNNADATGTANKTITLTGSNASNNIIGLRIVDPATGKVTSLVKSGSGFWALTNSASTYTGTTTVNAGILSVTSMASGGSTSSIGASTSAAANLVLAGGTLQYTGAGASTDRLFTVSTNGGGIDGSGGGVAFTNTGALSMSGSGARTLTLTGTSINNSLASQIQDNGGATSLVKNGSGAWAISGSNSYSGGTTLTAGQLIIGNANALGTGALTINGGSLATAAGTSITLTTNNTEVWGGDFTYGGGMLNLGTGAIQLTASRYVTVASGTLAVGGVISGAGYNLTKLGNGNLILTGSNTFTGALLVKAGSVTVDSINNGGVASSVGAGTNDAWALQLVGGGTLVYTGTGSTTNRQMIIDTAGTIDNEGSGALVFSNSSGVISNNPSASGTANKVITLTGTNNDNNTMALRLADPVTTSTTSIVKAGTGYWLISGGSNTYSGATNVQNGTLAFSTVGSGTSAQSLGSGNTVNLGVAAASSGTLQYTGAAGTFDKNIYAYGNGLNSIQNSGSGLLTLSGSLVKNGTVLVLNGGSGGINVTGVISGASDNSDLYVTGGTTKLSAQNSYNGPTWVYGGGTLVNGVTNALPTDTALILGGTNGGTDNSSNAYDLNGYNQTVAVLSSTGSGIQTVTNNGTGASTLTITDGGTYNGVIADGSSSTALNLTGGNLVLGGNSTYSGATSVTGGTLTVNGSLTNSAVTLSGAALTGSGSVSGAVSATNAAISGNGLSLGATTLYGASTLSGRNSASSVTVAGGTTTLTGTTQSTSALTVAVGATFNVNGTLDGSAMINGVIKGNGTVTGDLNMASTSTLVAAVTQTADGLSYDELKVSGNVRLEGSLDLQTLSGLTLTMGETIVLVDNTGDGTTSGYFATIITTGSSYSATSNANYTFNVDGTEYLLSYNTSDGGSNYNDVTLTVVPEPGTWAMLLGGLGLLLGMQRAMRREE